jgi:hypothetical protein
MNTTNWDKIAKIVKELYRQERVTWYQKVDAFFVRQMNQQKLEHALARAEAQGITA